MVLQRRASVGALKLISPRVHASAGARWDRPAAQPSPAPLRASRMAKALQVELLCSSATTVGRRCTSALHSKSLAGSSSAQASACARRVSPAFCKRALYRGFRQRSLPIVAYCRGTGTTAASTGVGTLQPPRSPVSDMPMRVRCTAMIRLPTLPSSLPPLTSRPLSQRPISTQLPLALEPLHAFVLRLQRLHLNE